MKIQYDDIVSLYSRLDSSILFTLVRMGYDSLRRMFTNEEILLLTASTLTLVTMLQSIRATLTNSVTLQVILTISSALLSQAIVNTVTDNTLIFHNHQLPSSHWLIDFVAITAVLLFAASTPNSIQKLPFVNRSVTLILYMYTDATGILLHDIGVERLVLAAAILLYVLLIRFSTQLQNMPILLYFTKAVSMVSIDTILTGVSSIKHSKFDNATQAGILVIVVFIIEALCSLSSRLEEAKGFAVWKCAQLLFTIYTKQHIAADITFFLATLIFTGSVMGFFAQNTLVQLMLLITVNVLLNSLTSNLHTNTDVELFVLFISVLVLHIIPELLQI